VKEYLLYYIKSDLLRFQKSQSFLFSKSKSYQNYKVKKQNQKKTIDSSFATMCIGTKIILIFSEFYFFHFSSPFTYIYVFCHVLGLNYICFCIHFLIFTYFIFPTLLDFPFVLNYYIRMIMYV